MKTMQRYASVERWKVSLRKNNLGVMLFPVCGNERNTQAYAAYDVNCLGLISDSVSPETGWLFMDALITRHLDIG